MYILLYVKCRQYSGITYIHHQLEEGELWCMCNHLYVKLIQSSGILWIYGQLEEWVYVFSSICETYVVSGIIQIYGQLEGVALVYVHSSICETYTVQWYYIRSMVKLKSGGPWYMCILLYVQFMQCNGIIQIYGQLEEGSIGIYAFTYI